MALRCRFKNLLNDLDVIGGANYQNVRMELNKAPWSVLDAGLDLSPPPMRRAIIDPGVLRDGSIVAASAYDNRILTIPLLLEGETMNDIANELRNLNRELNRVRNVLEWWPDGASKPVFFRTFRSPDYILDITQNSVGPHNAKVTLRIVAEPFALGEREQASFGGSSIVDNNPAGATNPQYAAIAASEVLGDVETPAFITVSDEGTAGANKMVVATRRHGTPADFDHFFQAEAATNGTDCTDTADANASGGTMVRCTFATNPTVNAVRLSGLIPNSDHDNVGRYRVFLRCKKTTTDGTMKVQLRWGNFGAGQPFVINDQVSLRNVTAYQIVDLGLFQNPYGVYPEELGYGPPTQSEDIIPIVTELQVWAERTSGTGSLDMDFIFLMPADEELCILGKLTDQFSTILDGPNDMVYQGLSGVIYNKQFVTRQGAIPLLAPNQDQRIYFLRDDVTDLTDDYGVAIYYWPRYLYVRPA